MATPSPDSLIAAKAAAGKKAAEFIQDGMRVGLGTGSTAFYFIDALVERCRSGLRIEAVATSERSHEQALKGGIRMIDPSMITSLDIAVDGADEIDTRKRMIKGGGGALLREKIIATMSKEMVVIVDEGKCVEALGKFPLPVEIVRFGHSSTISILDKKGYKGDLRKKDGAPFQTDNGNYIYDITFQRTIADPEYHESIIKLIPGVVTTGFFFHLAGRVVIGQADGSVKILP